METKGERTLSILMNVKAQFPESRLRVSDNYYILKFHGLELFFIPETGLLDGWGICLAPPARPAGEEGTDE